MNHGVKTRRLVLAWAALTALSVGATVAFAAYGDSVIRGVEARRLQGRAEDLLRVNRLDEAARLLAQAVDAKANSFPARRLLVRTLLRSGRFAEAEAQARAGVESVPPIERSAAQRLLEEVLRETGQQEGMNR